MIQVDLKKKLRVTKIVEKDLAIAILDKQTNKYIKVDDNFEDIILNRTYYQDLVFLVYDKETKEYKPFSNPEFNQVYIECHSNALGDNITWIPIVDLFQKKHKCKVIYNTKFHELLQPFYLNIEMKFDDIVPAYCEAIFILGYSVSGKFDTNGVEISPKDCRTLSLQEVACEQLGIKYKEVVPNFNSNIKEPIIKGKYVVYTACSTGQFKLWNNEPAMVELLEWIKSRGYTLVKVGEIPNTLDGLDYTGKREWNELMNIIENATLFIGLPSGLSVLSWALRTKTVIIDGITQDFALMQKNIIKIQNKDVCNGCWNDTELVYDNKDVGYCPRKKDFECTKSITFEMVKNKIEKYL